MYRRLQRRLPPSDAQTTQQMLDSSADFAVQETAAPPVSTTDDASRRADQQTIHQPEIQRAQPYTFTVLPPGSPPPPDDGPVTIQPSLPNSHSGGFLPIQRSEDLADRIRSQLGKGAPLGPDVQRTLEQGLGSPLSGVRVHTDPTADTLARSVQAVAFTTGSDIFFRQGVYQPDTPQGLQLLAHEATHTIQQARGPVDGTPHPGGVLISDPRDCFEQAAEITAQRIAPINGAVRVPVQPVQRTPSIGSSGDPVSVQRDIKPGDPLPDFRRITNARVEAYLPIPRPTDDQGMQEAKRLFALGDALRLQGTYRDREKDSARKLIADALSSGTNIGDAEKAASDEAKKIDKEVAEQQSITQARTTEGKVFGDRLQYINVFFGAVRRQLETTFEVPTEDLRTALKARLKGRSIPEIHITGEAKRAFAAALKEMPFVRDILSSKDRNPSNPERVERARWKGDRHLQDDITPAPPDKDQGPKVTTDYDDGSLRRRVIEADNFIRLMVEPDLLQDLNPPTIVVHMKYGEYSFNPATWFDKRRFRAHQSGNEVHIAQDEATPIIVHEVGHYLESHLPPEAWSDITKLILARDMLATKGPTPSTAAVGSRGEKKEGGFAGEYPVTGPYTSRAYSSGDTEVMSLTVEFLKRTSDTLRMIQEDPVQTALILRALRPREYRLTTALRPFDKYLPQDAGWTEPTEPRARAYAFSESSD